MRVLTKGIILLLIICSASSCAAFKTDCQCPKFSKEINIK